jgi:hypothetical protein
MSRLDPLLSPDFAIGADVEETEEVEPCHVWPEVRRALTAIAEDVNRMSGPGGPTLN